MLKFVNQELPGVIIRFRSAELSKAANKKIVKVTLDAEVNDEAVWEVARQKLDGMKIYTVNDFQTGLLDAMRQENKQLEARSQELARENLQLSEENKTMKAAFSVLGHQINTQ